MKKPSQILKPRQTLSLGDLILAVSSCTKNTKETVATVADLLGLRHAESVSTCHRRYSDMLRPVISSDAGRCRLWLRPEIETWARKGGG